MIAVFSVGCFEMASKSGVLGRVIFVAIVLRDSGRMDRFAKEEEKVRGRDLNRD